MQNQNRTSSSGKKMRFIRWTLYLLWTVGLIWSAIFTELLDDEAYYWVYSQNLSLGYHDHPPLIAWSIYIGFSLFKSEFGVRLAMILFHLLTIRVLEYLISPKSIVLFFAVLVSIPVFQFSGFWAVPDTPFLFACTVLLLAIKRFSEKSSSTNAIFLGIVAALVLFAKYHGALFIFFLLLYGNKMFRKPTFYISIAVGIALYLPHLIWLIEHDFPTFMYHFGYRNAKAYEWQQTLSFLGGQFLLWGPIAGFLVLKALFYTSPHDYLRSIFIKTSISVYAFLFVFSFFGHVEGNWSLGVFPLMITALFKNWEEEPKTNRILLKGLWISVPLLLIGRLILVFDIVPFNVPFLKQFYGQKEWVEKVDSLAGDRPVVFMNSYQKASKFWFYAQKPSTTLSNIQGRRSQFDLLNLHESWLGKPVLMQVNWASSKLDSIETKGIGMFYYSNDSSFWYFPEAQIVPLDLPEYWQENQTKEVEVSIHRPEMNREPHPPQLDVSYSFMQNGQRVSGNCLKGVWNPQKTNCRLVIPIRAPEKQGKYQLIFSIERRWMPMGINSRRHDVIVE